MNLPPLLSRAIQAQLYSPSWDSQQGLLSNVWGNVRGVMQHGRGLANDAYAVRNMQDVGPLAHLDHLQEYLHHGDTTVPNPWDRLLFTRMTWPS